MKIPNICQCYQVTSYFLFHLDDFRFAMDSAGTSNMVTSSQVHSANSNQFSNYSEQIQSPGFDEADEDTALMDADHVNPHPLMF
jgi:hypothetical protein